MFVGCKTPEVTEYLVPMRMREVWRMRGGRWVRPASDEDIAAAAAIGETGPISRTLVLEQAAALAAETPSSDDVAGRMAAGESLRTIAADLGVAPSTLSRRLKRASA